MPISSEQIAAVAPDASKIKSGREPTLSVDGSSVNARPIPVAVLSPIRLAREALQNAVEADPGLVVTCACGTSRTAITALARAEDADGPAEVLLLDASSPDALVALPLIRDAFKREVIVVWAARATSEVLLACARSRVAAILDPEVSSDELRIIIHDVAYDTLKGSTRLNAALLAELAALHSGERGRGNPNLTGRERQIAFALANGLTNKEIACELCISLSTVKTHVHSVLGKLGIAARRDVLRSLHANGEV